MADLISARLLAQMRALNESALPSLCTVFTPSYERGAGGTTLPSYLLPRFSGLPCRVTVPALPPGQVLTAEQLRSAVRYRVDFAAGVDVRVDDRFIIAVALPNGTPVSLVVDCESVNAPQSYAVTTETECSPAPMPAAGNSSDGDEISRT